MTIDLFIRSYYRDFEWLKYCLQSVRQYCTGFQKVVIVVPKADEGRLRVLGICDDVEVRFCERLKDDYFGQQVTKLDADRYCSADFICHVDSDCLFRVPLNADTLFGNYKPTWVISPYAILPNARGWQSASERFMGRHVEFDFMRRQPIVISRELYSELRKYCLKAFNSSLAEYALSNGADGFSEYNALGAFAYYECNSDFAWSVRNDESVDESICRWFWSWSGVTEEVEQEIIRILSCHTVSRLP